jgi:hypothetical protein
MPGGGNSALLPLALAEENAVSSAILYLAIVAIWAGILVPRWVRRSHDGSGTAKNQPAAESQPVAEPGPHADAEAELPAGAAVPADGMVHEHGVAVEHGVAFEYDAAFEYGTVRAGGTGYEHEAAVEHGAAVEYHAARDDPAGLDASDSAGGDAEPGLTLRGRQLWSEEPGWRLLRRRGRPRPAVTRTAALRARRRMLTALVTLTIVAVVLTAERMAPLWIIAPPAGMLGLLVLVLRGAARADAKAAERAAAARAAYAARQAELAARRRARETQAAPEPTAEIIDISARVNDQLYDQYADGAVRAVGD